MKIIENPESNMALKDTIDQEIKQAMLAKDKESLLALRSIKSMILLAETAEGASGSLSQDAEMKLLAKALKQRQESAATFAQQGRNDLAEKELAEAKVIERFMPKQLSEAEIEVEAKGIIAEVGASSAKDLGKVMGLASKRFAGRADGKLVADVVKKLLA